MVNFLTDLYLFPIFSLLNVYIDTKVDNSIGNYTFINKCNIVVIILSYFFKNYQIWDKTVKKKVVMYCPTWLYPYSEGTENLLAKLACCSMFHEHW